MKKMYVIILFVVLFSTNVSAWDDTVTHPHMTEQAIKSLKLDSYLQKNLNLPNGIQTQLTGPTGGDGSGIGAGLKVTGPDGVILGGAAQKEKTAFEWLKYGSHMEDLPLCRAANHFHNPLIGDWKTAGQTDTSWTQFIGGDTCAAFLSGNVYSLNGITSAAVWATALTEPPANAADEAVRNNNEWVWYHARQYYHTFLTGKNFSGNEIASDENDRKRYLALCFRAIGHNMHLLQDMSVPAHVRNDFSKGHSDLTWFKFLQNILPLPSISKWPSNRFETFVEKNDKVFDAFFKSTKDLYLSQLSLTNFWDADQYIGTKGSITGQNTLGLSEYTNYNFVSEYTIFTENLPIGDKHYFPFPKISDTGIDLYISGNLEPVVIGERTTLPIGKFTSHGELLKNFVKPTYFTYDILQAADLANEGDRRVFYLSFGLDNDCYRDYAELLIPRAIGYSAKLLDYFFRGEIDLDTDSSGYVIKNLSEEEMDGTFGLYYDNSDDKRTLIRSWNFQLGTKSSGNNKSSPVTFDIPTDIKNPAKLILVFKGTLGAEKDDAVVGKVLDLVYVKVRVNGKDCHNKRWIRAYNPEGFTFRRIGPDNNTGWYELEAESDICI